MTTNYRAFLNTKIIVLKAALERTKREYEAILNTSSCDVCKVVNQSCIICESVKIRLDCVQFTTLRGNYKIYLKDHIDYLKKLIDTTNEILRVTFDE